MDTYQLASGHWRRPFSLFPSQVTSDCCRSAGSTSMRADSSNCRLRYGVLSHLSCSALRSWASYWIRTLVSSPSSKTTSMSTRMLTKVTAYQYLSQLETTNPKFQRKEDVLWYLITVGGFIIVGLDISLSTLSTLLTTPLPNPITTHIGILGISARIVQFSQLLRFLEPRKITVASRPPIIRKIPGELRCDHGGNALDDPSNILRVLGRFLAPYISTSSIRAFCYPTPAFLSAELLTHDRP